MYNYNITVFRQSRVLVGLFLTPIIIIGLIVGVNLVFGLLLFAIFLLTYYYFIVGHLTVRIDTDSGKIFFDWTKKHFFNYKEIEPVNISSIERIVVDNGVLLRKIRTKEREIQLNTAKFQQKDTLRLIYRLEVLAKDNDAKRIDSWDEWNEKGYLKIAYRVNSIILVVSAIIVTVFVFKKGFDSRLLFFMMLLIPQMILYGRQMKRKM